MSKLLPCPFCGGDVELIKDVCSNEAFYTIHCDCGCRMDTEHEWETETIDAWNTRVEHPKHHTNCNNASHQCDTCKHSEGCNKWCSKCNEYSDDCYYELNDDMAQPTIRDIYDLLESHDIRADFMYNRLLGIIDKRELVVDAEDAKLDQLGVILTEINKHEEAEISELKLCPYCGSDITDFVNDETSTKHHFYMTDCPECCGLIYIIEDAYGYSVRRDEEASDE